MKISSETTPVDLRYNLWFMVVNGQLVRMEGNEIWILGYFKIGSDLELHSNLVQMLVVPNSKQDIFGFGALSSFWNSPRL